MPTYLAKRAGACLNGPREPALMPMFNSSQGQILNTWYSGTSKE